MTGHSSAQIGPAISCGQKNVAGFVCERPAEHGFHEGGGARWPISTKERAAVTDQLVAAARALMPDPASTHPEYLRAMIEIVARSLNMPDAEAREIATARLTHH